MSNQLYKKIKSGFQTVPMILYIGQNITDEALKAILANPWSAVITSRTDDIFATLLPCIKKKIIIIKNGTAFPTEPLSGSYCFVFQPFSGNDGKVNEKKAYRMFGNIIDRYLVNVSQMVIVGYDDSYEAIEEGTVFFQPGDGLWVGGDDGLNLVFQVHHLAGRLPAILYYRMTDCVLHAVIWC